jgi:putative colanic acid biosynthesis acetyltransferase WcaF
MSHITAELDIRANRQSRKYSGRELALRAAWSLARPLFRWSPRPCFAWRRFLLRRFGARIGAGVNIYGSVEITLPWNLEVGDWSAIGEHALVYNLGPVVIGSRVTISQRVHLCAGTHDYTKPDLPLLKPPIVVRDQAWVCADAFIGPGVTIGEGTVIGARAVVVRNAGPWLVLAGNPAREIRKRELLQS